MTHFTSYQASLLWTTPERSTINRQILVRDRIPEIPLRKSSKSARRISKVSWLQISIWVRLAQISRMSRTSVMVSRACVWRDYTGNLCRGLALGAFGCLRAAGEWGLWITLDVILSRSQSLWCNEFSWCINH